MLSFLFWQNGYEVSFDFSDLSLMRTAETLVFSAITVNDYEDEITDVVSRNMLYFLHLKW